jgi:hypothetical protein
MIAVILTSPHIHEGQLYPAGSTLDLPDALANWLISQGIADLLKFKKNLNDKEQDDGLPKT